MWEAIQVYIVLASGMCFVFWRIGRYNPGHVNPTAEETAEFDEEMKKRRSSRHGRFVHYRAN